MEKRLREAIKEAMKNKNASAANSIIYQTRKNILETAQKIAKDKRVDITDSLIIDAAKREIKQTNDMLEILKDKSSVEEKINMCEIALNEAKSWLPEMVSEDEIKSFIEANKNTADNMGSMMKLLKETFGDRLDGKMASQIAKASF